MDMRFRQIIFVLMATLPFLAGCFTYKYTVDCPGGERCAHRIEIEGGRQKIGLASNGDSEASFDASRFVMDFSGSSKPQLNSISPSVTVTLFGTAGQVIDVKNFGLNSFSDGWKMRLSDPSSLEAWWATHRNSVGSIEIESNGFESEAISGTNVGEAEVYYDVDLTGGDSDSYYVNPICLAKPWICDDPYL